MYPLPLLSVALLYDLVKYGHAKGSDVERVRSIEESLFAFFR